MLRRLIVLAPVGALALCLYAVQLPLFVEWPGSAREVLPLIDIDGVATYQPRGQLLLTTVNQVRGTTYDALWAAVDDSVTIVPEQDVIPPGQTDAQYEAVSLSQMDESKIAAVSVALRRLTDYPRDHGPGVIVQDVVPGAPADGVLFPGDLITAVDGEPLAGAPALTRAIAEAGTRTSLRFTVEPVEGGEAREVVLRPAPIPGQAGPKIGIVTVANFPFPVRIESGDIGGPSAGLMWSLGVTDLLTPADLTDGRRVAGTGTIDLAGNVGPIGGIRLKIETAEDGGAEAFILPVDNLAEARGAGGGIELVPVRTMEEAVRYLERSS